MATEATAERLQTNEASGRALRVCVDARLLSGGALGGVEQFVIGLADGLSKLGGGGEEYSFLTYADNDEWLRPYVAGACRITHGAAATRSTGLARVLSRAPLLRSAARKLLAPLLRGERAASRLPLPRSDGTVERAGFDLIHFPTQSAFLTELPSIYHPWDLQHLHLPEYFTPEQARKRETEYRAFCAQARVVSVASRWQKLDLIKQYGLPREKVRVVPAAPVVAAYPTPTDEDLRQVRQKFSLPARFLFYPAQTWPHKNHLGLLEALALLRDREGLDVPLVCSGKKNDFYAEIEKKANELGLESRVKFLGFVTPLELQSLYRLCRAMVFPTLFEGFGMPLVEAFEAGAPVACASVTSLPEQAGDAALLFDPRSTEETTAALRRLWTDDELCRSLVAGGRARARAFTWERTARTFRAHYRWLAARPLAPEDDALLSASE